VLLTQETHAGLTTTELPTGTVTFLFTDIEGSTMLLKRLGGDRYHDVLAEHQSILRTACAEAGGREIDTQGDSFFFAFRKAKDAVATAIAAQRALAAFDWPEGVSVRVRMGLDTGEPVVGADRYVGLGVHRTARIMAAGHGGQILLSATTRNLAHDELPNGVALRDLGNQRLKDLDHPVHLYQVVASDLPARFPRLRTLDSALRARLWKRRLPIAGGALGLVLLVIGIVLATRPAAGLVVAPNSVGIINPSTNKVVGQIAVGVSPSAIDVGAGSVWAANKDDKTLSRIDSRTRTLSHTITLSGSTPTGVAVGKKAVWVAEGARGALVRVDPTYNLADEPISITTARVSGGPRGSVAVGAGSVWVAFGDSDIARINPVSRKGGVVGYADFGSAAVAYGEGALWIANANSAASTVTQFSPVTNRKVFDFHVGREPSGVAVGEGAVWVADTGDDAVSRIDPGARSVTTIPVGHAPVGIDYGEGAVWVANSGDGTVSRIDPATSTLVKTIKVGGRPVGIAAGDGFVWVTVEPL
jgi:YVTN family beta-propeller protein